MAKISFDNGNTYYDPIEDRDEIAEGLEEHDWDVVVNLMDDETREDTHLSFEYDEGDRLGFLIAYLKRADDDLVIG